MGAHTGVGNPLDTPLVMSCTILGVTVCVVLGLTMIWLIKCGLQCRRFGPYLFHEFSIDLLLETSGPLNVFVLNSAKPVIAWNHFETVNWKHT